MGFFGSGGGKKQHSPVEAPDSLIGTATAHGLDVLSAGKIKGLVAGLQSVFLDGTPIANPDGSLNRENFQLDFRFGEPNQEPIDGFKAATNPVGVNVELKTTTPWTQQLNNTQLNGVNIKIRIPALQRVEENGDVNGTRVEYDIQLSVDGSAFVSKYKGAFDGKASSGIERGHYLQLPKCVNHWTLRVLRTTADSTDQTLQNKTFIDSYTEVINGKLIYPHCALAGWHVSAEQFSSEPARLYHLDGLEVKVPSNYNPETRQYTGIWDGTFQVRWTDNPAWVFYDIVTNKRYGTNSDFNELSVDKWRLYRIAQYCDELVPDGKGGQEPRYTFNYCIASEAEAHEALHNFASAFNGSYFYANDQIIPTADMPDGDHYTFTPSRVVDGKFQYSGTSRDARFTVAAVTYFDRDSMGRQKQVVYKDDDGIRRYGYNRTDVIAFGCDHYSEALRRAVSIVVSSLYETDAVTFAVGLEHLACAPGSVIKIADPLRMGQRMGGLISAVAGTAITLDKVPNTLPVAGDDLIVNTPAGKSESRKVVSVSGRVVTIASAYTQTPVAGSTWCIERPDIKAKTYRVISVSKNEDLTWNITAIQHEPSKYQRIDYGRPMDVVPTFAPTTPSRPTNLVAVPREVAEQGTSQTVVNCAWDAVDGAVGYDVWWRIGNGNWNSAGRVSGTSTDIYAVPQGQFEFKVAAVGIAESGSPARVGVAVPENTTPPIAVVDAQADATAALQAAANAVTTAANDATAKANQAKADALAALAIVNAKADTAMAKIADIANAPEHSTAKTYLEDALVKQGSGLYRAKVAVPAGIAITNTAYWEYVGEYDSIGEALAASIAKGNANATALASEVSRMDALLARVPASGNLVNQAAILAEQEARASEDSALAARATNLEATVNSTTDGNAALKARIASEETTRAGQHEAQATQISGIIATNNDQQNQINSKASITQLNEAIAGEAGARATAISNVQADYDGKLANKASITQLNDAIANEQGARSQAISNVQADYNGKLADKASNASVTDVATAAADALGVQAGRIDSVMGRMPAGNGQVADASVVQSMQVEIDSLDSNPNLIVNPVGINGTNGWQFVMGHLYPQDRLPYGNFFEVAPNPSGETILAQDIPVSGNAWYTLHVNGNRDVANGGIVRLNAQYKNGANGIGDSAQLRFENLGDNYRVLTFLTPSNCDNVRLWFVAENNNGYIKWLEPKLEAGQKNTKFNKAVEKLRAQYVLVVDVNGKIAGMKLASDGATSDIEMLADNFKLITGGSTGVELDKTQLNRRFGSAAFYEGDPFGSDSLVMWIGPSSIAKSSATKANATLWFDSTGKSGYGGSVIQASNIKRASATITNPNIGQVETGNFARQTGSREVSVSYGYFANKSATGTSANSQTNQSLSGLIEVSVDGGAWAQVGGFGASGVYTVSSDSGITLTSSDASGSGFVVHSGSGTNLNFRARITSGALNLVSGVSNNATISIKVEQI